MASNSPTVEKDADAEGLFWEVRLNDAEGDLVLNHYLRVKVYTDRGRESQSKIDLPFRRTRTGRLPPGFAPSFANSPKPNTTEGSNVGSLPAGFAVDEVPDAVKLETPFGSYTTSYEVANGQLVFKRQLSQRATTIPADQYEVVRKFFESIRAAENAPVVLARK